MFWTRALFWTLDNASLGLWSGSGVFCQMCVYFFVIVLVSTFSLRPNVYQTYLWCYIYTTWWLLANNRVFHKLSTIQECQYCQIRFKLWTHRAAASRSIGKHYDAWKWVPDPFPSGKCISMETNLPLPLDARSVHTLSIANRKKLDQWNLQPWNVILLNPLIYIFIFTNIICCK